MNGLVLRCVLGLGALFHCLPHAEVSRAQLIVDRQETMGRASAFPMVNRQHELHSDWRENPDSPSKPGLPISRECQRSAGQP